MKKIYEQRIYCHNKFNLRKFDKFYLEVYCEHNNLPSPNTDTTTIKCTDRACVYNDITQEDIILVATGFNIYIFFSYLLDMFPNNQAL